jgi:dTDP-4-amino-4,6-dideoxygalactose transaminase
MKKIQMVDLQSQYQKIKPEIDTAMANIIHSAQFVKGPEVQKFEQELADYLQVKHVISCGNGTDALQIALMSLGLQPGDEVITADFTFAATVEVIHLLKLTAVLVDVEPDTFNINIDSLKKAITPKTKAIIPVHLFGQAANMEAILQVATEHNLYVVEDNAQAIGASYTFSNGKSYKTGTMGTIGTTSFFPSKNLGCYGDGGALFTNDDDLAYRLKGIVNHGMYKRYYHDEIGVNSRLDGLQAAVLRVKLPFLDDYNKARQKAADIYDELLKDFKQIDTPYRTVNNTHVFHQYTLVIKNNKRDALAEYLKENGIPFGIYYPVPLHLQKAYKNNRFPDSFYPVTMQLVKDVISLPMHTELEREQQEYIVEKIIKFLKNA